MFVFDFKLDCFLIGGYFFWGDKRLVFGKGKLKVNLILFNLVYRNNKVRLECKNVVLFINWK